MKPLTALASLGPETRDCPTCSAVAALIAKAREEAWEQGAKYGFHHDILHDYEKELKAANPYRSRTAAKENKP